MNLTRTLRAGSIVALALFAASATVAAASTPEPSAAAPPALTAGTTIQLPSGKSVVLPKDFDRLSIAELAKLGITPGMGWGADGGATVESTASTVAKSTSTGVSGGGVITPQNASGCNKQVCILLEGVKLRIDFWQTDAYPAAYTCTYAAYWRNTTIIATSPQICGGAGSNFWSVLTNMPRTFLNGTVLCNSWVTIPGKPCKTVHS